MQHIIIQCRPGFENDAAAEIGEHAKTHGVPGFIRANPDTGLVDFVANSSAEAAHLITQIPFRDLIFIRQWFLAGDPAKGLPQGDRIAPLLRRLPEQLIAFQTPYLETLDTNEGKTLSPLIRSLTKPMIGLLRDSNRIDDKSNWRLHVLFTRTDEAYIGITPVENSSPWPMGIPRLRFPRGAPSRSVLKLEEAFHTFLSERQRQRLLRPGTRAVDLGAAPGGWTWYLMQQGCFVTAIDNGTLHPDLLASGQIEHLREDGFRYRPRKKVTWMVCDMVEQPRRIASLVADWVAGGWCQYSIFNLKLPMKKRYAEVQLCRQIIADALSQANVETAFRSKQLYHDREEVTCFLDHLDT